LPGGAQAVVDEGASVVREVGAVVLQIAPDAQVAARGRPPSHFHFRNDQGVLLVADAGATGVRTTITDLGGQIRDERRAALDITIGRRTGCAGCPSCSTSCSKPPV
jgi:hypothetical protein